MWSEPHLIWGRGAPGRKAAWFRQAARQLRTRLRDIRAVVYFDDDHRNFGASYNWRVTTSSSALAAFRAFARNPYFSVRPKKGAAGRLGG